MVGGCRLIIRCGWWRDTAANAAATSAHPTCPGAAPVADWVCVNGGWVPPEHPLAGGGGTPPPPPPPTPSPTCPNRPPAPDWVCVNGGWVPPDHPLAGGAAVPLLPLAFADEAAEGPELLGGRESILVPRLLASSTICATWRAMARQDVSPGESIPATWTSAGTCASRPNHEISERLGGRV